VATGGSGSRPVYGRPSCPQRATVKSGHAPPMIDSSKAAARASPHRHSLVSYHVKSFLVGGGHEVACDLLKFGLTRRKCMIPGRVPFAKP
jgi:hypothetical protein